MSRPMKPSMVNSVRDIADEPIEDGRGEDGEERSIPASRSASTCRGNDIAGRRTAALVVVEADESQLEAAAGQREAAQRQIDRDDQREDREARRMTTAGSTMMRPEWRSTHSSRIRASVSCRGCLSYGHYRSVFPARDCGHAEVRQRTASRRAARPGRLDVRLSAGRRGCSCRTSTGSRRRSAR